MNQLIGIVVIGRNEGERLKISLDSALNQSDLVVYVDSGSTDNSMQLARQMGCHTVELDMSVPFTAARGRNVGADQLLQSATPPEFIQFIDGDCILADGWLEIAANEMRDDPMLAVACGRRREKYPENSIYNRLCDLEWDTPIGEVRACGGDALMRVSAFRQNGGFDPTFAAGEEPELCYRMRQNGWKVRRIGAEMTLHDANITSFNQWWRRAMRAGSAYAHSVWRHGRAAERFGLRESASIWLWAALMPALAIGLTQSTRGFSLLLLGGYLALALKVYLSMRNKGIEKNDAVLYAASCVIGKFPQLIGQTKFYVARQSSLIEYK